MSTNKEKASWLAGLLSGWGVKESWAKVIAGAIIGGLVAAGVLSTGGCTADYSRTPEGVLWSGAIVLPVEEEGGK